MVFGTFLFTAHVNGPDPAFMLRYCRVAVVFLARYNSAEAVTCAVFVLCSVVLHPARSGLQVNRQWLSLTAALFCVFTLDMSTNRLPYTNRLRAFLVSRTLGLSRNKGKDKSKGRRGFGGHGAVGMAESLLPSCGLTGPALVDTRPSSEPLGAGARVYGCLFDAVGDINQVS